jgi:hypothetical protein
MTNKKLIDKISDYLRKDIEKNLFLFIVKILTAIFIFSILNFIIVGLKERSLISTVHEYGSVKIYQKKSGFWGETSLRGETIRFKIPVGQRYSIVSDTYLCNKINVYEVVSKNARFIKHTDYEIVEQKDTTKLECE